MTTVRVDIDLLKKYFSDHYDFINDPADYFEVAEYELESKLKPIYEDIRTLCDEYRLNPHTDTFFNLFVVSRHVKFFADHAKKGKTSKRIEFLNEIQFRKELFSLFLNVLNNNYYRIKSLSMFGQERKTKYDSDSQMLCLSPNWIDSEPFQVTDTMLLEKFKIFILDSVAELYFNKKWGELNSGANYKIDEETGDRILIDNEVTTIIDAVNDWMEQFGNSGKGAPKRKFFLKQFARSLEKFAAAEMIFESPRQRHLFIAKLLFHFKLLKSKQDKSLISSVEYLLKSTT